MIIKKKSISFRGEKHPQLEEISKSYNELYKTNRKNVEVHGWIYDQSRIHLTIFEFLQSLDFESNLKLLEVGCGRGELTEKLIELYPNIFAIDISLTAVKVTKKRTKGKAILSVCDSTSLPFRQSSFDIIICSEVIEHVIDKEKLIVEFNRTLRRGGHLILTTPNPYAFRGFIASLIAKIIGFHGESKQKINEYIPSYHLKKMLLRCFEVEYVIGLVYNFPYMERIKKFPKACQHIMVLMNRISESIERQKLFTVLAQYLCFNCVKK